MVAAGPKFGVSPSKHLQRLVHQVGSKLPPQRVPAPAGLRLQSRKNLGLLPPSVQPGGTHNRQRIPGRGQHRSLHGCGVHRQHLRQRVERLIGDGRDVLETRFVVLGTPKDGSALEVDVRPPKLANRADPVAGLVREDESVPIPLGQGGRVAVPSEEPEEHVHGGPVVPPRMRTLGGRHLLTVGVKQLLQRERLGLGFGLAVGRVDEACGELIRLPLRARPVAVLERPGEPAPVLSPLDLEDAGLRVGEDPDPVPAPFAGAVAPAASSRACHRSIPLSIDGLHDLRNGRSRRDGFSASRRGVRSCWESRRLTSRLSVELDRSRMPIQRRTCVIEGHVRGNAIRTCTPGISHAVVRLSAAPRPPGRLRRAGTGGRGRSDPRIRYASYGTADGWDVHGHPTPAWGRSRSINPVREGHRTRAPGLVAPVRRSNSPPGRSWTTQNEMYPPI